MNTASWFGLLGTFAFGLLSILFYFRPRKVQRLQATYRLVTLAKKSDWRLSIRYGDTEYSEVREMRLVIRNSGAQEIRRSDIDGEHLTISGGQTRLLAAEYVPNSHDEPRASVLTTPEGTVHITFPYLNVRDSFGARIVFAGEDPRIQGRIMGGQLRIGEYRRPYWSTVTTGAALFCIAVIAIMLVVGGLTALADEFKIGFIGFVIGLVVYAAVWRWPLEALMKKLDLVVQPLERLSSEGRVLNDEIASPASTQARAKLETA